MQPKPTETAQPEPERDRDYSSRLHGAISSSIFSIGDLFRDGQKGVRFPKDLIKVLEQKLQDIAMGKDAAYVFLSFAIAASEIPEVEREYRARPRFFHNIMKPPLRALLRMFVSTTQVQSGSNYPAGLILLTQTVRDWLRGMSSLVGREAQTPAYRIFARSRRGLVPLPVEPLLFSPSAICVVRELGQLDMVPRSGQSLLPRLRESLSRTLPASHLEP